MGLNALISNRPLWLAKAIHWENGARNQGEKHLAWNLLIASAQSRFHDETRLRHCKGL
jgi:hypothetical protein